MAAPHGKLFAAIVAAGASFGAASCYLSHELGDAGAARDAGTDARVAFDAGTDAGTDAGFDAGDCPAPLPDGRYDCSQCAPICATRHDCACTAFCCFI